MSIGSIRLSTSQISQWENIPLLPVDPRLHHYLHKALIHLRDLTHHTEPATKMIEKGEKVSPPEYSGNSIVDESGNFVPINPFKKSQLLSYSLNPKVVPNYVLDKMSLAHYKDQLKNSNVNNSQTDIAPVIKNQASKDDKDQEFLSFANDPFIRTINNNWANLLNTVKMPSEFAPNRLSRDESFSEHPDYSEPWGGDERLRNAFLGYGENIPELKKSKGIWGRLFSRKTVGVDDDPRHRSKAGYWMLDEKRKDMLPTLRRIFVQNPLVPLLLRVLILIFSTCALALAASVYLYLRRKYNDTTIGQQPSTIFAIVVQSFAIVYIVYIAYDEYSGKPMGLRNALGKMKLIMLDLLLIMCSSANMSLTFDSLYDEQWVCKKDTSEMGSYPTVDFLCRRQKALASFLLLVLCLWVLTFTISILRVVDRVSIGPRSD